MKLSSLSFFFLLFVALVSYRVYADYHSLRSSSSTQKEDDHSHQLLQQEERELQSVRYMIYIGTVSISSTRCGSWSPSIKYGCSGSGSLVDFNIVTTDGWDDWDVSCTTGYREGTCRISDSPSRYSSSDLRHISVSFACVGSSSYALDGFVEADDQFLTCSTSGTNLAINGASMQYAVGDSFFSSQVDCEEGLESSGTDGLCTHMDFCSSSWSSSCYLYLDNAVAVVDRVPSWGVQDCNDKYSVLIPDCYSSSGAGLSAAGLSAAGLSASAENATQTLRNMEEELVQSAAMAIANKTGDR